MERSLEPNISQVAPYSLATKLRNDIHMCGGASLVSKRHYGECLALD